MFKVIYKFSFETTIENVHRTSIEAIKDYDNLNKQGYKPKIVKGSN